MIHCDSADNVAGPYALNRLREDSSTNFRGSRTQTQYSSEIIVLWLKPTEKLLHIIGHSSCPPNKPYHLQMLRTLNCGRDLIPSEDEDEESEKSEIEAPKSLSEKQKRRLVK
ncbi:uncharacterized protein LOC110840349 [Zootermopsis nevadensis]|nr:uncharacterized protein LOC110840349 [Zootermopsis nevadensis]